MKILSVVIKIKPEHQDFVRAEYLKVLAPTRKEKGCLFYELHEVVEDPCTLMFYEAWETVEDWQNHNGNDHIVNLKAVTDGMFVEKIFYDLKKFDN